MEISTAIDNYSVLRGINPYEKLTVDTSTMELSLDMRYLQGLRRAYNNDGRKDLLAPILNTFQILDDNTMVGRKVLMECVDHLMETFAQTYHNFSEMTEILQNLKEQFSEMKEVYPVFVPQRVVVNEQDIIKTLQDPYRHPLIVVDKHHPDTNISPPSGCSQFIKRIWNNVKQCF